MGDSDYESVLTRLLWVVHAFLFGYAEYCHNCCIHGHASTGSAGSAGLRREFQNSKINLDETVETICQQPIIGHLRAALTHCLSSCWLCHQASRCPVARAKESVHVKRQGLLMILLMSCASFIMLRLSIFSELRHHLDQSRRRRWNNSHNTRDLGLRPSYSALGQHRSAHYG